MLALIAVALASTASLAQRGGPSPPTAPAGGTEFVKIAEYQVRKDRIDLVRIDLNGVSLSIYGHYWPIECPPEEVDRVCRALGLPPRAAAEPAR